MNQDIVAYQQKLKENISVLIENGKLKEAKGLLNQYERIVKDDIDVYSIKGVISIMEGDIDEAERVLKEGLVLDASNFDVLYNLGYLYQTNNNNLLAIEYYKRALKNGENEEIKDSAYEILKALGVEESKEEIIRDVIDEEKILLEKAKEEINPSEEMNNLKKQFKENIQSLIEQGSLEEAKELLKQYEEIVKDDIDVYSIKGVIAIMKGNIDEAKIILNQGLTINSENFDLNYNLAYLYEQKEQFSYAVQYYKKALRYCKDENISKNINDIIEKISSDHNIETFKNKKRIVFFVKQGMDNFLSDIINGLFNEYEIKKIIVTDYKQIEQGMHWADICWFEWCDELIIYGSKLPIAKEKKIICRLHRYEAFTDYPKNVMWENVDKLIIVTEHLKKFLISQIPDIEQKVNIITINNGVNLDKFEFKKRNRGFNIAYVGYIHQRKNPVLLLQIINKLIKKDKRYKLYVAGQFQDALIELYWNYQVEQMGLQDNIIFQGWQKNINRWLEDKSYIISTSIHESFGYGIAEAMSIGLKPIIHNFIFAKEIWDDKYLFNTIDEAINMITDKNYDSEEYREFIKENYSLEKQMKEILEIINSLIFEKKEILKSKKKITLIYRTFSGSNTIALYKLMPKFIKNKYNVELIKETSTSEYFQTIINSDFIVTTHGNYVLDKKNMGLNQKVLELWHGIPAKAMGYLDKQEKNKETINLIWDNIDYLASYSKMYNKLLNACIRTSPEKYKITGMPRNDLLVNSDGNKNLEKIFNKDFSNKKIIFYMPTFRECVYNNRRDGNKKWNNIFGMNYFNDSEFNNFMCKNNIILVLKLHPNEEAMITDIIKKKDLSNVILLEENQLETNSLDLYEVLNSADVLITDYSSVYFDFLILNRPIIFTPTDLNEYINTRGYLLLPYKNWICGPIAINQIELQNEILNSFKNGNIYINKRKELLIKLHKYVDNKSSLRIWNLINDILSN